MIYAGDRSHALFSLRFIERLHMMSLPLISFRRVAFALTLAPLAMFYAASPCTAGKYNPVRNLGDQIAAWPPLPGIDGQSHGLDEWKSKELVVVVFTCNSCPYATDYETRINDLAKRYAGPDSKVAVIALNVNKVPEDSLAEMQARAKKQGFVFPYLFDESQQTARDFGATFTPEFYILDRDRKIAYMGAFDDETDPAKVKARYVEDAIVSLLKGEKPAVAETIARGCLVRYARQRTKK